MYYFEYSLSFSTGLFIQVQAILYLLFIFTFGVLLSFSLSCCKFARNCKFLMWFLIVLNVSLLKSPYTDFVKAFCISPNVCPISDLKFVSDLLPKGMSETLLVSSSQIWVSLMILSGIKLYFLESSRRIGRWLNKKFKSWTERYCTIVDFVRDAPDAKLNWLYYSHESLHMSSALEGVRVFYRLKPFKRQNARTRFKILLQCINIRAAARIRSLKGPDCFLPI